MLRALRKKLSSKGWGGRLGMERHGIRTGATFLHLTEKAGWEEGACKEDGKGPRASTCDGLG